MQVQLDCRAAIPSLRIPFGTGKTNSCSSDMLPGIILVDEQYQPAYLTFGVRGHRFTLRRRGSMTSTNFFRGHAARVACMMLGLSLALTGLLNAQGVTSATLLGTVTDSGGAVVPNASIEVKNVGTGQVQQVRTDAQGRYTVPDLPIGDYEAQAV